MNRRHPSSGAARFALTLGIAAVLALGGTGVWFLNGSQTTKASDPASPSYTVRRGDLRITLKQTGTFAAEEAEDIRAYVRGGAKVEWLIDEGALVKKSDRLVELDKEAVLKEIEGLGAQVEKAKANLVAAEADQEITRLECDSKNFAAALSVEMAELEIKKFQEGLQPKEQRDADIKIEQADAKYRRLKATDDRMREMKMLEQGFVTKEEVEQSALDVKTAKNELETARLEKQILVKYTHDMQLKKLRGAESQATAELERFKQVAKRRRAQTQAATTQCQQELSRADEQLKDARERLAQMTIRADTDGIVVYGAGVRSRWRQQEEIKVGSTVYNRQVLMRLPNLNTMELIVRVNEADINKIHAPKNGAPSDHQAATITIDSMPGQAFRGYVKKVDTLAQSTWYNEYVKWFPTTIGLDRQIAGVRPGMSATVEILVGELHGVLTAPIQYVQTRGGRSYCTVRSGGRGKRRPVVIGASNNSFVEIKQGIEEGDVLLFPESAEGPADEAGKGKPPTAPRAPRARGGRSR